MDAQGWLLTLGVAVAGVLHTLAPDHWVPITLIARQRGWSRSETALAAVQAGAGHVVTTLILGLLIWTAGASAATQMGHAIDTLASVALIAFGGWIAWSSWRDMRRGGHGHGHGPGGHHHHHHGQEHSHDHADDPKSDRLYARSPGGAFATHIHIHRHGGGLPHIHWHDHDQTTAHALAAGLAGNPPLHVHAHRMSGRTALLVILGSSPMIEGLPAFLAAARLGATTIVVMSVVFALSTIATYVALCVLSAEGMQRIGLGPLERYGEMISGIVIAGIGAAFWLWPMG
jgi:ABC-type nickel/cobalt efflux system permease component RcnA